jgi:hypothetical protein
MTGFGFDSCGADDCYFMEKGAMIGLYFFALPSYIYWCVFTFTKRKPFVNKPLLTKILALGLPLYLLLFITGIFLDQIFK